MLIKAIETKYHGIAFRSRKEARWAVFFDEAGIPWEYEPEAYKLPTGGAYLPDFWLPEQNAFWEVKGTEDDESVAKWWAFAALLYDPNDAAPLDGREAFLSFGPVGPAERCSGCEEDKTDSAVTWGDRHYRWCECGGCGAMGIEFDGRSARIPCPCRTKRQAEGVYEDKDYNLHSLRLHEAYSRARSFRFWEAR